MQITNEKIQRYQQPVNAVNSYHKNDSLEACFAELIDIIQPKVVLCLGKKVFDAALHIADVSEPVMKGPYNDVIQKGAAKAKYKTASVKMVPLAHCGSIGTLNRNRLLKPPIKDPLAVQCKDRRKIRNILSREE